MKTAEWLAFFRQHRAKKLFSLEDLLQMTAVRPKTLLVELSRLVRKGIVERPARGWYANPLNPPSLDEIAMALRFPSYISLEHALSRHNVLSQTAFAVTLVTTRPPHTYLCRGQRLEYHEISRHLFWGYRSEGGVNLALPEKALLDLIHIRHVARRELTAERLASLLDDMYLEELDEGRLLAFAARFSRPVQAIVARLVGDPRRLPTL